MAERYSKLFSLESNLYSANVPVMICAGVLSKDNQTDKVFVQLRMQNVDSKYREITALKVSINSYDPAGNNLGESKVFQYLDLNVARGMEFGGKQPINLDNVTARSFSVSILEVVFSSGETWSDDNGRWVSLRQKTLEEALGNNMAEQYRRDTFAGAKYELCSQEGIWLCACGALNPVGESKCCHCKNDKVELFKALDHNVLAKTLSVHTEKTNTAQKKAQSKKKLIAIVCAVVVLLGVVIATTSSKNAKEEAMVNALIGYTIYKDQNYHSYFYDENTVHGKRVTGFIQEDPWEVVSISGNKMKLKLQSSTYEVVFGEESDGTYYVISLKKISGV